VQLSTTAGQASASPGLSPHDKPSFIALPALATEATLHQSWPDGPTVKPLDYAALCTSEDVHADLERTVQDLGQWLNVLDVGLGSLLSFVPAPA
jgi:hypothetical protein